MTGHIWAIAKTTVRSLFLAGHDTVILDATNVTRARRKEWASKLWFRKFVAFFEEVEVCKQRAREQYPDEIEAQDGLICAIERMDEEYEVVVQEELYEGESVELCPAAKREMSWQTGGKS